MTQMTARAPKVRGYTVLLASALLSVACSGSGSGATDATRDSSRTPGPHAITTTASSLSPRRSDSSRSPRPVVVTVTSLPSGLRTHAASVVASNLDVPWGIDFLPDGTALVTERDTARLLQVSTNGLVTSLGTVPGVTPTSEGGLLGVAVSPTYSRDSKVYVYATTTDDNRVLSGTLGQLVHGRSTVVLSGIPRGEYHDGGRLAFGPDGKLYVTTGETGQGYLAQTLDSLGGKILRINADGSIPPDNPFPGSPVWSYGHRNVQGIAWDARGRLWATEFGSSEWDEINLIRPGRNYGWPAAEGAGHLDGMTDPYAVFSTSVASPSGLAFARNALWLGALQGETTWRVPVTTSGLGTPQAVRLVPARTRTVVAAPDGLLWVTTSTTDGRAVPSAGDDRILAIRPKWRVEQSGER
jgi:glucose/arabinose dehydrogenase